jgi:hypothetical protein
MDLDNQTLSNCNFTPRRIQTSQQRSNQRSLNFLTQQQWLSTEYTHDTDHKLPKNVYAQAQTLRLL